jgi:methyl-accepting chemotaxis protein
VNNCNQVGKKIFEISKDIDKLRIEMVEESSCLDNKDKIDIYKVDHLIWRWKVYNMLLHYEVVDKEKVASYKGCRLGQWYYGIECKDLEHIPAFKSLEKPHIALHEAASKATDAYTRGDLKLANNYLEEMDKHSVEVFRYLDEIKKSI